MWVKGHSGVAGNEDADRRANLRAYGGRVTGMPNVITPAGIRHDFRIHDKPKHLQWSRKAVKGLTYVITDRGPLRNGYRSLEGARTTYADVGKYRMRYICEGASWWEMVRGVVSKSVSGAWNGVRWWWIS